MTARIAMIGYGAMGAAVAETLARAGTYRINAVLLPSGSQTKVPQNTVVFHSATALEEWRPNLVVECAGHEAVKNDVPAFLATGVNCIVSSIGALGDASLRKKLAEAAQAGQSKLITVAGAVGGLDALRGLALAGLDDVTYRSTKPPAAWRGSKAEGLVDLSGLRVAEVFFEGNAARAAADYPKNANVTAAVALAGVGFDKTKVKLVADPVAKGNRHDISVSGPAGKFTITLENAALPSNPRTSWLAALSVAAEINRFFSSFQT